MTVSEKIKSIDNKIEQNKAQHKLEIQTAEVLEISSGNVCKYKILTGEDILREKGLLGKAATIKNSNIHH